MIIFKPHEALTFATPYLTQCPIIIEAGSFNGSDTIRMAQQWPNASIHAFEPVPELFKKLQQNTASYKNITCYPFALSDQDGFASFYVSEKPNKPGVPTQAGSLKAPKERLKHSPIQFPGTIPVRTITLDSWAKKYNIDPVNFIWLDLQGHELSVLQASKKVLSQVSVLHTEVSFIESYEKQPMEQEITRWLLQQGFTLIGQDYSEPPGHFFGNRLFAKK